MLRNYLIFLYLLFFHLMKNNEILEKKLNKNKFQINQIIKPDFNIHELREIIGYNNVLPCVGEVVLI